MLHKLRLGRCRSCKRSIWMGWGQSSPAFSHGDTVCEKPNLRPVEKASVDCPQPYPDRHLQLRQCPNLICVRIIGMIRPYGLPCPIPWSLKGGFPALDAVIPSDSKEQSCAYRYRRFATQCAFLVIQHLTLRLAGLLFPRPPHQHPESGDGI